MGKSKTTTFVAALRSDALTAPLVIDGAMTGDHLVAYVAQVLVPTLRPGGVVIWDNLGCHKRAEARRAIEAAGATLAFPPPYSPDLNPIEQAFSTMKAELRRREERTVNARWAALGESIDWFPPDECRLHIEHAGYSLHRN